MERFEQPDLGPHLVNPPGTGRIRFSVCCAIIHQLLDWLVAKANHKDYKRAQPMQAAPGPRFGGG
jgi:hypothetical protein